MPGLRPDTTAPPTRRPGAGAAALLLASASAFGVGGEAPGRDSLVRATCKGVHELASGVATVECAEASVLSGPGGLLLPHGTGARAALGPGRLEVEAAGGSIRGEGSAPREASAMLRTRIRFDGEPFAGGEVRVALEVRYAFTGFGAAGLDARLRTSTSGLPSEGSRVRIRLEHRGLSGVHLSTVERRGRVSGPEIGAYPSAATLTIVSVETLPADAYSLVLRGDLAAHSLGNLSSLEPVSSATVRASGSLVLELPCSLRAYADDGRSLAPVATRRGAAPAGAGGARCRWRLRLAGDEGEAP